jgi:hypothetical protein
MGAVEETRKLEFGSVAWLEALHKAYELAWLSAPEEERRERFSMSEAYLNPPGHLARPDGAGWQCRFDGATVTWAASATKDVDLYIEMDYDGILPLVRMIFGDPDNAAERERIVKELIAADKLRYRGDFSRRPPRLEAVHDAMARITA